MTRSFILLFGLSVCVTSQQTWPKMSFVERVVALNAIADECKTSRGTFDLQPDGELFLKPDQNEETGRLDCALERLKHVLALSKIAFVGNSAVEAEKK